MCGAMPALTLQFCPPLEIKEDRFPSVVPWGCYCQEGSWQHTIDLFFLLFYKYLFIWLKNLFFHTKSVVQELCQAHQRSTESNNCSFFQGMHECGYNIFFICCIDGKWLVLYYFICIPHQSLFYFLNLFHGILQNTPISISRHPIVVVETFKSKSLTVSRHCPEQPFRPDLVLTFALGYFSWESFVANSSIGLLTWDTDWFGVSLISYIKSSLLIPV